PTPLPAIIRSRAARSQPNEPRGVLNTMRTSRFTFEAVMRQSRLPAVAVLAMALAIPSIARSATLHVANTGTDGPACGATATPCRSIGNAVANAVSGDTIMVGPGLYSADLDRDGSRSEPGEEPVLLTIDKAVTILSTFGASSTVIEGAGINIAASNVTFGKLN